MDILKVEEKVNSEAAKLYCPKRGGACAAGECWAFKVDQMPDYKKAYGVCLEYEQCKVSVSVG